MSCKGPLNGYKILDLTQFEAGTVCTETLAWLGAEVWKVERPVVGEAGRYSVEEPGVDAVGFIILNMNKKSVTCNMKTPEGKELIWQLIPKADVIIENMGPGAIDRLGFDYESVRKVNQRIVYTQIKGFGMDGPYADYPAFNPVAAAMGGLPAMNGYEGGEPLQCGINIADSGAGYMCAIAVLGALMQRDKTGEGQRIEVSLRDTVIAFGRSNWEPYYRSGVPKRVGNGVAMENVAPCNMYPCKPFGDTDYVHIYCSRHGGSNDFEDLCRIIGREDFLSDPRMQTPQSRYEVRDEIDAAIAAWTSQHTKMEAMNICCKAGIPAGAVLDCEDITNDEYLRRRGMMIEVDHRQRGKLVIPGFAARMSGIEIDYQPSPALGEHNREIYGGVLGLSDEKLRELKEKKVI